MFNTIFEPCIKWSGFQSDQSGEISKWTPGPCVWWEWDVIYLKHAEHICIIRDMLSYSDKRNQVCIQATFISLNAIMASSEQSSSIMGSLWPGKISKRGTGCRLFFDYFIVLNTDCLWHSNKTIHFECTQARHSWLLTAWNRWVRRSIYGELMWTFLISNDFRKLG